MSTHDQTISQPVILRFPTPAPLDSVRHWLAEVRQSRWELAGWLLMAAFLAAAVPWSVWRAATDASCDFPEFHAAGQHVLSQATRDGGGIFRYYLPSLDVAWVALAWLPRPAAAGLWCGVQIAAWVGLLIAVVGCFRPEWPARLRRQGTLGAALLTLPLVVNHLCLGAFHILMVYWMVTGLLRVSRGQWKTGAVLLGLAVWIKLLPGLAVAYLFWKGQWKPALLAGATAVLVNLGLCLVAYGPATTIAEHRHWWDNQAQGAKQRILTAQNLPIELRSRNQSLVAVLRRTLTNTWVYEMSKGAPLRFFALASLSSEQVKTIHTALQACLVGCLAWHFLPRPRNMSPADWTREIAVLSLATMWFSPIVWGYHFVSATPALAVVLLRGRMRPDVAWIALALWVTSFALLSSPAIRAYGVLYWMSLALGGTAVWASRLEFVPESSTGETPASLPFRRVAGLRAAA